MIARSVQARWLALLVLLVCGVPSSARAEARVVLSVSAGDPARADALATRIARELSLRGFTVVRSPPGPNALDEPALEMAAQARRHGAALGVAVRIEEGGDAHIDVVDRVTGKHVERTVSGTADAHGPSTLAVATAELVDASLIELRLPARTMKGEVEPPRDLPVPDLPRPSHPRWQFDAQLGALWPVRHRSPFGALAVGFAVRPVWRVAIGPEGTVPLHALRRDTERATIRSFPFLAAMRVDVDVLPRRSPVRLDLQAAVAAAATRIDVDAAPGVRSFPQTVWTAAFVGGPVLRGRLGRHGTIGVAGRVVAPVHDLRVRESGRIVQRLGPVWLGLSFYVGARW